MSNLEEEIRKNRSAFDDAEPPTGHSERFERRLGGPRKPLLRRSWYWMAAAVVALIVLVRVLEPQPQLEPQPVAEQTEPESKMTLAEHSQKMAEVEAYFTGQIEDTYQLVQLTAEERNGQMELLIRHLTELEKDYEKLKLELYRQPGDERILNRMIENYRLRLKLLEWHLNQLNQTPKNTENENV